MKIYTIKDDKVATDILLLLKLNGECTRLHWSRSIKDVPYNVMSALETIEEYVEHKVLSICGSERSELTEDEESVFLNIIKNNKVLKDTLGTGVVIKGEQARKVKKIIKTEKGMKKIEEAIESGENVVIF